MINDTLLGYLAAAVVTAVLFGKALRYQLAIVRRLWANKDEALVIRPWWRDDLAACTVAVCLLMTLAPPVVIARCEWLGKVWVYLQSTSC